MLFNELGACGIGVLMGAKSHISVLSCFICREFPVGDPHSLGHLGIRN